MMESAMVAQSGANAVSMGMDTAIRAPAPEVTGTTPVEALLWLNGAMELAGDAPPTPEQWAKMRTKVAESMGYLAKRRFLAKVEGQEAIEREERLRRDQQLVMQKMQQQMHFEMEAVKAKMHEEMQRKQFGGIQFAPDTRLIGPTYEGGAIGVSDPRNTIKMALAVDDSIQKTDSIGTRLRNLVTKVDK
jgi:hypothetical protein